MKSIPSTTFPMPARDTKQKEIKDPVPPARFVASSWGLKLFLAAAVLSAIALWISHGVEDLPPSYILCSAQGRGIYTVDEKNSKVQCIAVHQSRIMDTGDLEDIRSRWNISTDDNSSPTPFDHVRYIPSGAIVVPGISDSHCHILEYGASRQIPLSTGKTIKDTVTLIEEYIKADPDILLDKTHTIEGWGWDHESWDSVQLPTYEDLEANPTVRGRPIILQSRDGHALWVSRKTLDANTPYPDTIEGGVIVRDQAGNPTGVFIDSAQELIAKPLVTDEDMERHFRTTVKDALAHGLTSLHDAGFKPDSLAFFKRRSEQTKLPIRIYGMTYFDDKNYFGGDASPLYGDGDTRLSARSIKIFADGALRTGGAALKEPYSDDHHSKGVMRISPKLLKTVVPQFMRDGWQVNVHAIGDRANGLVLDAFEIGLRGKNASNLRPRLEHAQIMTDADLVRVGKLGIIASIQPSHVISDMWFAEDRLGPDRVKGLYAFRSLIENGVKITLGSDFPVEEINPLLGFYAAITRLSTDGQSPHGPDGWFPDQRLTRQEALRGMTIDPAYASFSEQITGSLTPAKRADYVVLSQDIMTIPVDEILETKVLTTVIDGRVVYGRL